MNASRNPHARPSAFPARLAGAALLLATACATAGGGTPLKMTPLPGPPPASEQERGRGVGELSVVASGRGGSVLYGPWRVAGPGCDLTFNGEAWIGSLGGASGRMVMSEGRLDGANAKLIFSTSGQAVSVRGRFGNSQVALDMTPDTITGRFGANAPGLELKRESAGQWSGTWGPGVRVTVTMRGEAEKYPEVLTPQFYLALIGMFL